MTKHPKPIICTFWQLSYALNALHQWNPAHVATLHDVWLKGAPTPNSRLQNPKGYDPRKQQAGNYEARIVLPTLLKTWVTERAAALGVNVTGEQALALLSRVRVAFDGDFNELTQVITS